MPLASISFITVVGGYTTRLALTRKLLEERDGERDYGAPYAARLEEITPLLELERDKISVGAVLAAQRELLDLDLAEDPLPLELHPLVGPGEAPQPLERAQAVLVAVAHGQPPRREGKELDADSDHQCGGHLQEERQPEGPLALDLAGAVRDPVGDDGADDDGDGLEDEEGPP